MRKKCMGLPMIQLSEMLNMLLDIDSESFSRSAIYKTLSQVNCDYSDIQKLLTTLSTQRWDQMVARSRETTTHYKWHLLESRNGKYDLWLHEYKSQNLLRAGYALSVHNHRYWFSSRILRGGFVHNEYAIALDSEDRFHHDDILIKHKKFLKQGSTYELKIGEIHGIEDIQPNTVTLVIQSKPEKSESYEFLLDRGLAIKHNAFECRRAAFNTLFAS